LEGRGVRSRYRLGLFWVSASSAGGEDAKGMIAEQTRDSAPRRGDDFE
jgi:hypothetical protein